MSNYIIRILHVTDDGSSLSEACSTPIIGAGSRSGSSHTVIDVDDMDSGLHSGHLATRASLSSLGVSSKFKPALNLMCYWNIKCRIRGEHILYLITSTTKIFKNKSLFYLN